MPDFAGPLNAAFGESAVKLCALAATLLGWRPAEFWAATPAELAGCFAGAGPEASGVDAQTLDELRRRFPD